MDDGGPKTRVNGALLRQFQGRSVCLLGKVSKVDQQGYSFQLTTSDGQDVLIQLQEPLQDLMSGIVEVHGSVTGPKQVMGLNFIQFPEEMSQNFDMEQYNKAVELTQKFSDPHLKV